MKKRFKRRKAGALPWRIIKWTLRLLLLALLLDAAYLYTIWPDWDNYRSGPIKASRFIETYRQQASLRDWPRLRWNPVAIESMPRNVLRAVIAAEDARFYDHDGVDLEALGEAMEYNLSRQRLVYGGSTISQQTVKNLFLTPSRNPLRKWHELLLTLAMESYLPKRRILEYYLNVAEFGRGIYGVDAAARYYWSVPVAYIGSAEAIELAATLPSPVNNNPRQRTRAFEQRVKKIRRFVDAHRGV